MEICELVDGKNGKFDVKFVGIIYNVQTVHLNIALLFSVL